MDGQSQDGMWLHAQGQELRGKVAQRRTLKDTNIIEIWWELPLQLQLQNNYLDPKRVLNNSSSKNDSCEIPKQQNLQHHKQGTVFKHFPKEECRQRIER